MPFLPNLSYRKKSLFLVALFLTALMYFLCASGINNSNDGSHVALAKALYHDHSVRIEKHFSYVNCCDFAVKDARIFSDRLPGNAFLMQPFLALADGLRYLHLDQYAFRHELDIIVIHLLPILCGVLLVFVLFQVFLYLGFSYWTAFLSSFIYASCTQQWVESIHGYSHAPSALLVLAAVFLAMKVRDPLTEPGKLWSIAALLGVSTVLELQNLLFIGPVWLYLFSGKLTQLFTWRGVRLTAVSGLILGVFLCVLLGYNYYTFGEFFLKSNTYNPNFPEEKTFMTALSGNFLLGLDKLFTSFSNLPAYYNWKVALGNDTPGIWIASPVLLIALWGYPAFFRAYRREFWLFVQLIVLSVLVAAFHKTTLIRHIFTVTPYLFIPFALVWNRARTPLNRFGIVAILSMSLFRTAYFATTFWPAGWAGFFPFQYELVYFFLFFVPVFATGWVLWMKRKTVRQTIYSDALSEVVMKAV